MYTSFFSAFKYVKTSWLLVFIVTENNPQLIFNSKVNNTNHIDNNNNKIGINTNNNKPLTWSAREKVQRFI